jgi:hypothetical protein
LVITALAVINNPIYSSVSVNCEPCGEAFPFRPRNPFTPSYPHYLIRLTHTIGGCIRPVAAQQCRPSEGDGLRNEPEAGRDFLRGRSAEAHDAAQGEYLIPRYGLDTYDYLSPNLRLVVAALFIAELMKACFELERALCPHRIPSATIAINRHAQFRPHRDSGAGNGQSISLIVALGDFVGGEIAVEGQVRCRYRYRCMYLCTYVCACVFGERLRMPIAVRNELWKFSQMIAAHSLTS